MHSVISIVRLLTAGIALSCLTPSLAQPSPPANEEAEQPIVHIPAALDDEARAAVAGMNRFTIDLYRQTLPASGNHFISPASVSVAMALVYRGAEGATADEIARVLHYPAPPADYLRAAGQIQTSMNFSGPQRGLATANAIWIDRTIGMRDDYQADVGRLMGAGVQQTDFRQSFEQARLDINSWVATQTRDRIPELLAEGLVTEDTRSVLINTIYWKGSWANPFDSEATRDEPFIQLSQERATVPTMRQQQTYQVIESHGLKAVNMAYVGNEVRMTIILPNATNGLRRVEAMLSGASMETILAELDAAPFRNTLLSLPRFSLDDPAILLGDHLEEMGMPLALSDGADFPGFISEPPLKISQVVHQANIDVDESGSEAAAATAILDIIVTSGGPRRPPPPPFIFRADHPFLFMLRDRRTGLILFIGRYGEVAE